MDASVDAGAWAKTGEKYKKSGFCLALSSFYIIFAKLRFTPPKQRYKYNNINN